MRDFGFRETSAMPGVGIIDMGRERFLARPRKSAAFFFLIKTAALTKYVVDADKNRHWHWLAFGNAQSAIARNY